MKLAIFVHDLYLSIGHSNAILEKINHLTPKQISSIEKIYCVCYSFDNKKVNFPAFSEDQITYIKIPFTNLKPFLLKASFYHIYSFLVAIRFLPKGTKKLSVGIASLYSDIIDLQFVHQHFKTFFFSYKQMHLLPFLYKKVLFLYYDLGEKFSFTKKKKYLALSKFVYEYMHKQFQISYDNLFLAYSSVNQERFYLLNESKKEIYNDLVKRYPILAKLDLDKPIHLYIGGYERKGLSFVLDALPSQSQIIIIGKPEANSRLSLPKRIQCFPITFTKELNLFYNLCDHFLFPTIYEPFGLVIIEAFATGMQISTTIQNVGASELLKGFPEVYLYKTQDLFQVQGSQVLDKQLRAKISAQRKELLRQNDWKSAAQQLWKALEGS